MKLMPSWVEGPLSGLAFPALRNTSISDLLVIRWHMRAQNSSSGGVLIPASLGDIGGQR